MTACQSINHPGTKEMPNAATINQRLAIHDDPLYDFLIM
jgi:hypothetical protein